MRFPVQTAGAAVLLLGAAGALPADAQLSSIHMATSIMSRRQGIMTGGGGASEGLQAGFTQKAFAAVARQYPDDDRTPAIRAYLRDSAASVAPFLSNATHDALAYPLDRLSNGNALLALSAGPETHEASRFKAAAKALRESIGLNRRSSEGGLCKLSSWSSPLGRAPLGPLPYPLVLKVGDASDAIRPSPRRPQRAH